MTLDYALAVVSGVCLFTTSFLALLVTTRPPSKNWRIYYEAAFGFIGVVGVGAVIWGGIRTAINGDKVEYYVDRIDTAASRTIPKKIDTQSSKIGTLDSEVLAQGGDIHTLQKENTTLAVQNGKLLAQNADLKGLMSQIATAAHLDAAPSGSAQELADQIIIRLSQVGTRVSALEKREPNSLYQGAHAIGTVANMSYTKGQQSISFGVVSTNLPLDFRKEILFQGAILKCAEVPYQGFMRTGAFTQYTYSTVICNIVGVAPQ